MTEIFPGDELSTAGSTLRVLSVPTEPTNQERGWHFKAAPVNASALPIGAEIATDWGRCRIVAMRDPDPVTQSQRAGMAARKGLPALPVTVSCEGGGQEHEGVVVKGMLADEEMNWDFDAVFWIKTDDDELKVTGWNVLTEILVDAPAAELAAEPA